MSRKEFLEQCERIQTDANRNSEQRERQYQQLLQQTVQSLSQNQLENEIKEVRREMASKSQAAERVIYSLHSELQQQRRQQQQQAANNKKMMAMMMMMMSGEPESLLGTYKSIISINLPSYLIYS